MLLLRKGLLISALCLLYGTSSAQRSYAPQSVLASGNWFKIAISEAGVYRMDIPFLNSLGINTSNLASSSIRLFGNGGQPLSEANAGEWIDDLAENAIYIEDGGDGILNGSDYILFFAPGPHRWLKDSVNHRFTHQKNLYSERSFYFITIGNNGRRVALSPLQTTPTATVNSFSGRYFHELDTVNFLSSGKEWYGEEFADMPGRTLMRNFPIPLANIITGSSLEVRSQVVARSIGSASQFQVLINNNQAGQVPVLPVGAGIYDLFAREALSQFSAPAAANNTITFQFSPGSVNAQGWLNWFEVFTRQQLSMAGVHQLLFRDWQTVGNNSAEFRIAQAPSAMQVWDVTDPLTPSRMQGSVTGSEYRFVNDCSRLREYVAFNQGGLPTPSAIGRVSNQDLHGSAAVDYIIVTHPPFLAQAQRIAALHQQRSGLRTLVVTTEQVYHEFGSGSPDPVAIRDFVKMFYDRHGADPANRPRYLLLFGDGSFDYKNRLTPNTNFVPAWENDISLDVLSTYASDDFYGFLDDQEDINSGLVINTLDIGIGRVPARNEEEAKNFVDKLESYFKATAFGPWRNNLLFIADDEDQNLHLQDAEIIAQTSFNAAPVFDQQKIYLDAFKQESGAGGSRYPLVNQAINNSIYNGVLIWNFTGHGGPRRLAEETVLDQEIVNSWNNPDRLPLFITATCDFAPYDNPLSSSLGENILLRPKTGAIALMTTTRVVFAFSNRVMNNNYMQFALEPDANGRYRSLGDAVKDAKNYTYLNSTDIANNRKFTLLGDPALTLAFPTYRVRPLSINGTPVTQTDTLQSAEKIIIEGEVTDAQGNLLTDFNGTVHPTVFDKPQQVTTLANDPTSQRTTFTAQSNILFRGKASVAAGKFSFTFRVPKDINYQYGKGKLSLYAEDGTRDGSGFFTDFIVGGAGIDAGTDNDGPEIKAYLNDEKFVNGGITNEHPVLLLKLADSSGINTVGTGIGHDIVATLDNDNNRFFVLNDFYQGEQDSYQKGTVRFQLPELEPGPHTLKVKAWDVLNNSSEAVLDFTVAKDEELQISHVLNYPNPFTTRTQFWFEHNKPGQDLQVRLQIFTVSGRIIKKMERTINTAGNRSSELEWDGRDDYGNKIGRGVYLYKLSVSAPGKLRKEKIERLVIF